jgi:hypothetical protein
MDFHRNGKPLSCTHARDGRLEGASESYHPDGTREIACYYVRDSLSGIFCTWYSHSQPRRIEYWQGDQKIGSDSTLYENGRLESVISYDHDLRNGAARVYHHTGRVWPEHWYDRGGWWTSRTHSARKAPCWIPAISGTGMDGSMSRMQPECCWNVFFTVPGTQGSGGR